MCKIIHMTNIETIGHRLRRLRKEAALQQVDVVAALDTKIDRSHISKIESGKALPSWSLACSFADLYGVSLDYLRFGEGVSTLESPSYVAKDPAELRLLTAWRAMNPDEKRAFALFAERLSIAAGDSSEKA